MLDQIVSERWLVANARYGFWRAGSEGNDIVLFDDAGQQERARFPMLRQQFSARHEERWCLADLLAPCSPAVRDHIGAFAVTAGLGVTERVAAYEAAHDDYSAILLKALADRLAEAFAELLHQLARREWGYEPADQPTDHAALLAEKYRGIRPALGYPACPDHHLKKTLFALLNAEEAGLSLTSACAMQPAASVSGLYFAHPAARYFTVGRIGADQVDAYAKRCGLSVGETERWLRANLDYESR